MRSESDVWGSARMQAGDESSLPDDIKVMHGANASRERSSVHCSASASIVSAVRPKRTICVLIRLCSASEKRRQNGAARACSQPLERRR